MKQTPPSPAQKPPSNAAELEATLASRAPKPPSPQHSTYRKPEAQPEPVPEEQPQPIHGTPLIGLPTDGAKARKAVAELKARADRMRRAARSAHDEADRMDKQLAELDEMVAALEGLLTLADKAP